MCHSLDFKFGQSAPDRFLFVAVGTVSSLWERESRFLAAAPAVAFEFPVSVRFQQRSGIDQCFSRGFPPLVSAFARCFKTRMSMISVAAAKVQHQPQQHHLKTGFIGSKSAVGSRAVTEICKKALIIKLNTEERLLSTWNSATDVLFSPHQPVRLDERNKIG